MQVNDLMCALYFWSSVSKYSLKKLRISFVDRARDCSHAVFLSSINLNMLRHV